MTTNPNQITDGNTTSPVPEEKERPWILVLLCVVILALSVVYYVAVHGFFSASDRSWFGDMFGGLSALFAGLAVAGVGYTILQQRQALSIQRRELRDTQRIMEGQREELEMQNATFRRQSFETTFFQLLQLHHTIVGGIRVGEYPPGRPSIDAMMEHFKGEYEIWRRDNPRDDEQKSIVGAFTKLYQSYEGYFSHYFQNFIQIILLIEESGVADKERYIRILMAQLSKLEYRAVFYYGLSPMGRDDLGPLLKRHGMLRDMPSSSLLENRHLQLYPASAWSPPL